MTPHVPTLAMSAVFVACILGMLLLCTWLQDRTHRALLWWGPSYLLAAVGTALLALRGGIPDFLSMNVANAVVILAAGFTWVGVRVFEGRAGRAWFPLALAVAWVLASETSVFAANLTLRISVASLVLGGFFLAAAFTLWQGRSQPLVSRWPAIVALCIYASVMLTRLLLIRIFTLPPADQLFQSTWFGLMSLSTLLFIVATAFLLLALTKERTELLHRRAALVDPLTGLLNRRAFLDRGEAALEQAQRRPRPASVLVFDLDDFKQINDRFGHPMGDQVLQVFSDVALLEVRKSDVVGRIGGEEFAAVLPDCDQQSAFDAAERIRRAFAARARLTGPLDCNASVSVGVATDPQGGERALSTLLAEADRAVYRAKAAGRNCVSGAESAAVMPLRSVAQTVQNGPLAA